MRLAVRVEWMTHEKHRVPLSPVAEHISLWPPGTWECSHLEPRGHVFLRAPQDEGLPLSP